MSINQDLENTGITKRLSLIVHLRSASDQYKLRHFGDIVYFSKKLRYCILYVDKKDAKQIINEISSLPFVVKVESSKEESIDLGSDHIEQQITDLAQKAEDKLQKSRERIRINCNENYFR